MGKKKKDGFTPADGQEPEIDETAEGVEEVEGEPIDENGQPVQAPPARDYEAELASEKEKYLRLAAEYDNYRRRSQKEREALFTDVRAETLKSLLPVYDNLDRALKAECSDPAYYKGVEMTMTQLLEIFEGLGVTTIETEGMSFDPALHNAVVHTEDESLGENMIVEEFQRGFKLNDKVIRFAMVKVAN